MQFSFDIVFNDISSNKYNYRMDSNMKKFILKFLSVLPQFIFKRLVKKFELEKSSKEKQPSFNQVVSNYENINKGLFGGDSELFKKYLDRCEIYGEYGVGVSTVFANKYKYKPTLAVDSDENWISNVKRNSLNATSLEIIHINLGTLKSWGTPESYDYRQNFRKYLNSIWEKSLKPDLVLVDGRFRVACFLTSLLYADKGTVIIFDDYILRPEYHIVEIFEKPVETDNRQAAFKVSGDYDLKEIKFYIEKFEFVFV